MIVLAKLGAEANDTFKFSNFAATKTIVKRETANAERKTGQTTERASSPLSGHTTGDHATSKAHRH